VDTSALAGLVGKGISITTNDPAVSTVQVVVRARVVGSVLLLPGFKAMLSNRQVETRSTHFLIRQEPGEMGKLRVTEPVVSAPWVDLEFKELTEQYPSKRGIPAGWPGDWVIVATLKKDAPAGHSNETIRFKTDLPREPEVTLNLSVNVMPPVNLNTPDLRLVAGQPQMVLASLRRDLEPQPVVLSGPDGLTARAENGRGRFLKFHLEWSGEPPDEPIELVIEVAGETQTMQLNVVSAE
jgi:hypothetical protein